MVRQASRLTSTPKDSPKVGGRDDLILAGRRNRQEILISRHQKFGSSNLGELEKDAVIGVRKPGKRGGRSLHFNGLREGKKVTEKDLDLLIGKMEFGI